MGWLAGRRSLAPALTAGKLPCTATLRGSIGSVLRPMPNIEPRLSFSLAALMPFQGVDTGRRLIFALAALGLVAGRDITDTASAL